jgi:hypothetical protein
MGALRRYPPGVAVTDPPPIDWSESSTGQEKGQVVVAFSVGCKDKGQSRALPPFVASDWALGHVSRIFTADDQSMNNERFSSWQSRSSKGLQDLT